MFIKQLSGLLLAAIATLWLWVYLFQMLLGNVSFEELLGESVKSIILIAVSYFFLGGREVLEESPNV